MFLVTSNNYKRLEIIFQLPIIIIDERNFISVAYSSYIDKGNSFIIQLSTTTKHYFICL